MPCRATQGGCVMVERSDKMWFTGEGKGKPLQYSWFENPMNSMKRKKDTTLKDELPRSVGAQDATGEEWRNKYRKNEKMEPKPMPAAPGTCRTLCCHGRRTSFAAFCYVLPRHLHGSHFSFLRSFLECCLLSDALSESPLPQQSQFLIFTSFLLRAITSF